MKDFEEFRKILNNGLAQELESVALQKAEKESNLSELTGLEKLSAAINIQRLASEHFFGSFA